MAFLIAFCKPDNLKDIERRNKRYSDEEDRYDNSNSAEYDWNDVAFNLLARYKIDIRDAEYIVWHSDEYQNKMDLSTFEELIKERNKKNPEDRMLHPSPGVRYQVELDYLAELCNFISICVAAWQRNGDFYDLSF